MMPDELKAIHDKLDMIITWQAAHAVEHRSIDRDMTEVRHTLFGGGGEHGLKPQVQTINDRCAQQRCGPWLAWFRDVAKTVVSGLILMFVAFLLFLYRTYK